MKTFQEYHENSRQRQWEIYKELRDENEAMKAWIKDHLTNHAEFDPSVRHYFTTAEEAMGEKWKE